MAGHLGNRIKHQNNKSGMMEEVMKRMTVQLGSMRSNSHRMSNQTGGKGQELALSKARSKKIVEP